VSDTIGMHRGRISSASVGLPGSVPVRSADRHVYRPPGRPPVRLTVRGRFLLVLVLAVVALSVVGFVTGRLSGANSDRSRPAAQRTLVVQPGDTLWSIAKEVAPGGDVRKTVYEIRKLNGLSDAMIISGQVLVLPE
jgi:nucleoid-associated protein YgaU